MDCTAGQNEGRRSISLDERTPEASVDGKAKDGKIVNVRLSATDPNSISISADNNPVPIATGHQFAVRGIEFDIKVTYLLYSSGARRTEADVHASCLNTDSPLPPS